MTTTTKTGSYWDGSPVRLSESVLTQDGSSIKLLIDSFTQDLKEKIQKTKDEFDQTIENVDFEKSADVLDLDQSELEVDDLDELVKQQLAKLNPNEYKDKLREALELQHRAAQYIVELQTRYRVVDGISKRLVDQAEHTNTSLLSVVDDVEKARQVAELEFNRDQARRLKMTSMVKVNPPPKFDHHEGFGTPEGMIAFFNEDLEEYFEDMFIVDKIDKCRLIRKTFGDKSSEYKSTVRRFFQHETADKLIKNALVTMRSIYSEIVRYIFTVRPKGHIGTRKKTESLTNFLHRWITMMDYCGTAKQAQGSKIIRRIFEKSDVLRCDGTILREFKKKFFVRHVNDEPIDIPTLLGFAQRLDMLYAGDSPLGMNIITEGNTQQPKSNNGFASETPTSITKIDTVVQTLTKQIDKLIDKWSQRPSRDDWDRDPGGQSENCFNYGGVCDNYGHEDDSVKSSYNAVTSIAQGYRVSGTFRL